MRPASGTLSAAGAGPVYITNPHEAPFSIGIGVVVAGGSTLTYSVQHTFDDPFAATFNPATATWFNHATLSAQTNSADGNYAFPVRAIRVNVTAYTTGSLTWTFIQAGEGG